MKNLLETKNNRVSVESKEADDYSAKVIDYVFFKLKTIFPAWNQSITSQEMENSIKKEWLTGLQENGVNSTGKLAEGFKAARSSTSPFFPSCGQFVEWCTPEKRINEAAYREFSPALPKHTSEEYDKFGNDGIKNLRAAINQKSTDKITGEN